MGMIRQWLSQSKYAGRNKEAEGSLTGPENGSWAESLGLVMTGWGFLSSGWGNRASEWW